MVEILKPYSTVIKLYVVQFWQLFIVSSANFQLAIINTQQILWTQNIIIQNYLENNKKNIKI